MVFLKVYNENTDFHAGPRIKNLMKKCNFRQVAVCANGLSSVSIGVTIIPACFHAQGFQTNFMQYQILISHFEYAHTVL